MMNRGSPRRAGFSALPYLRLPEPRRGVSLAGLLSLEELSFAAGSFEELSFAEVSALDLASFLSFGEESPPEDPAGEAFLA